MTPGIQPSKVKIMLRKKLAIRPVISTARGGNTTQKKYRSAFITNPSSPVARWVAAAIEGGAASSFLSLVGRWTLDVGRSAFSCASRLRPSATDNLRSPDSRADHGKDDAIAVRAPRFVP